MWVLLALCSAFLLGVYDVFKKLSLNNNAVLPVLGLSIGFGACFMVAFIGLSLSCPALALRWGVFVPSVGFSCHALIFAKAVLVLSSWMCGFFALKHLPVTIFSPIRATQPVWTIIGALAIFHESLSLWQGLGIAITLCCFFLFSTCGRLEGITWRHNVWLWLVIAATLLGACSGLYDKFLLRSFDRMAVQAYSTIYQSAIMAFVVAFLWRPARERTTPFKWRWSILGIAVFLALADYAYYLALSSPSSLISVVSTIRRSGAVIPFLFGAVALHEKNVARKVVYLLGVLLGVSLLLVH